MPKYLDHHKIPQGITPQAMQQMVADIKAGKVVNGVKSLNSFIGKNDAWCLTEAANAKAVHDIHKAGYNLELGPGDVTEVQSLV